jgi:GT2 family glycosyltransferase
MSEYVTEPLETDRVAPVVTDLSVIIPTLGRDILQEGVRRIFIGTHWPSEVIIVHQGDDPAVRERLQAFAELGLRVRYIPSTERGRAAAVNRGIRAARTPFVAITDDDCFVSHDWVARMSAELRADPERIVTGSVSSAGREPVMAVTTSVQRSLQVRPRLKFDILCGGNVAMARTILDRVGLFDDDAMIATAEDCEFAYRALRTGVPIEFIPDIMVEHWGWRTQRARAAQYRSYALSHGGFYGKYLRRRDLFIAARALHHGARTLVYLVVSCARRDRERIAAGRAYAFNLWRGVARGLRSVGRAPRLAVDDASLSSEDR